MSSDGRPASASPSMSIRSPGSVGSGGSPSFRRQRSFVSETGGGIDWMPKKYRPPKKIKPRVPFSADVKKQNLWVRNVTAPAVQRVQWFSNEPAVTLDNVETLKLHQPVPKINSPRSIKACLELGVDPTAYDLCVVDILDHVDDSIDEQIWRLRYEHAVRKRVTLLQTLQELRYSFTERDALNEFRPAKGKMAHVESTVVAANNSMSVQISSHRNERFHEKTRHWERTHQTNLAKEHELQKRNEYKTGESEAYIESKAQEKREAVKKQDRDNYEKTKAELRRLEFEKAESARIAKQERLRIDAFAAEKRRLDRIAEREMREQMEEKIRQKEAYQAQTRGILDWQREKVDAMRRAMEADDARRMELRRIRDEHDRVLTKAAKDDFQAKIDLARSRADDRLYGRIRNILDKEDSRNERQRELDEGERAVDAEAERRRLDEREAFRQFTYNEARRKQREKEDRIKQHMETETEKVLEHMAGLNFQKAMTATERQLVAEDRRFKAEAQAKKDAHYRFKLQQKIDRETAKADHIAYLRTQMRDDAVRTNVLEAEQRRLEREAARKELHGTYADAATPKSYTRGTRVYGKIGLGTPVGGGGEESVYFSSGGGRTPDNGRRGRTSARQASVERSPSVGSSERSGGIRTDVGASPRAGGGRAVSPFRGTHDDSPKRSFKYGSRNGMGDEPETLEAVATRRERGFPEGRGDETVVTDEPALGFVSINTVQTPTDGYDDENHDPAQEP